MSKMKDRNGCSCDGCRTYGVNTVRHTPKAQTNGRGAKAVKLSKAAITAKLNDKLNLLPDSGISPEELQRIVSEHLVTVLKSEGATAQEMEEIRQRFVKTVNDAFGYAQADGQGTDDPADNLDAMQAKDDLDDDDSQEEDSQLAAILDGTQPAGDGE